MLTYRLASMHCVPAWPKACNGHTIFDIASSKCPPCRQTPAAACRAPTPCRWQSPGTTAAARPALLLRCRPVWQLRCRRLQPAPRQRQPLAGLQRCGAGSVRRCGRDTGLLRCGSPTSRSAAAPAPVGPTKPCCMASQTLQKQCMGKLFCRQVQSRHLGRTLRRMKGSWVGWPATIVAICSPAACLVADEEPAAALQKSQSLPTSATAVLTAQAHVLHQSTHAGRGKSNGPHIPAVQEAFLVDCHQLVTPSSAPERLTSSCSLTA